MEFLTTFVLAVPPGTPDQVVEATRARQAKRARELARQGHLVRLWRVPREDLALGLWRARDVTEMRSILESLPLYAWMTVQFIPLSPHSDDPAGAGA